MNHEEIKEMQAEILKEWAESYDAWMRANMK